MSDFFPERPPTSFDSDSFTMKGWFQKVWSFLRGSFWTSSVQLSSFTVDSETGVYLVDSTSGAITVTIPYASGNNGRRITVKHVAGSNSVTLAAQSGDTIDGATTLLVPNLGSATVVSGGILTWYDINSIYYAAGSWTPSWSGSTGGATVTYGTRVGRYVRIGKTVWISFRINISAIAAAPTGDLLITGLPFTCGNTDESQRLMGKVIYAATWGGLAPITLLGNNNESTFRMYRTASADARDNSTVVLAADLLATSQIIGTAVYYLD